MCRNRRFWQWAISELLVRDGLDLLDEEVYAMQLEDLLLHLRSVGIKSKHELRFVLEAIPRLAPNEILGKADYRNEV